LTSPLLKNTDKFFWHGYVPFYEQHLPESLDGTIVEFGVFKGNSIRWLLERFPSASVIGIDILAIQEDWPTGDRVKYVQLDQGDEDLVQNFFSSHSGIRLIIDDGSHMPLHQSICLKHGFRALSPGGLYILEDIHTSHPAHSYYQSTFNNAAPRSRSTALSVLLAVDHLKRIGLRYLTPELVDSIDDGGVLGKSDIRFLFDCADRLALYRRSHLPDQCYNCGANVFNYHALRCTCGAEIFAEADSMSFFIRKRTLGS
jgi:hypothetical protein